MWVNSLKFEENRMYNYERLSIFHTIVRLKKEKRKSTHVTRYFHDVTRFTKY